MSLSINGDAAQVGVLLIGHGTRDTKGLAEFSEVVRQVAETLDPAPVESAYLELAAPTIATGLGQLIERGVRKVIVAPMLLFAAGHAKQDIPAAVEEAIRQYPGIDWQQADHLGCHPSLLDLSVRRFQEASGDPIHNASGCRLIVIGRGSHDLEAIQETRDYAERLSERVGIADPVVGFLAMARPQLPELLAEAAESDWPVIIVQPHLLFHGELLDSLQDRVREWQLRTPAKQWKVAGHLGSSLEVVAAVVDRCQQAEMRLGGSLF